ncbi:MAG: hypothetical protein IKL41_02405 [Clostridia bacterium]|nr:hypothetical protein [Clostridia bacterium]
MKKYLLKVLSSVLCIVLVFAVVCIGVSADSDRGYIVVTDTVAANTGADVSEAIQSIIDSNPNRTIYFPDGEYVFSKPIYTPADPRLSVSLELSDFAVLKAGEGWTKGEAVVQLGGKNPANDTHTVGSNYSLEGGVIDGSGVANGISINGGRETAVRNVSIKHTVVGLHIMYGANSGSSDSDIYGVNIIGTGGTDSVGIVLEGFDNTVTNVRIGCVYTSVHVKSGGNVLRNVHPLYYSDYTDFENSCGFLIDEGNNWFDYCYSDQFAIGFRTTNYGSSTFNNCFCYWYSPNGGVQTGFRADKYFNSDITSLTLGFKDETYNTVLSVGEIGGTGTISNLSVDSDNVDEHSYLAYMEDMTIFTRIFGFFVLVFNWILGAMI